MIKPIFLAGGLALVIAATAPVAIFTHTDTAVQRRAPNAGDHHTDAERSRVHARGSSGADDVAATSSDRSGDNPVTIQRLYTPTSEPAILSLMLIGIASWANCRCGGAPRGPNPPPRSTPA